MGLAALAGLYGMVVSREAASASELPWQIWGHILSNVLANSIVGLFSWRTSGRFDRQLAQVISRALLAHGVLGFLVLVTRSYFSIPVLLLAFGASIVLGVCTVYLRPKLNPERVGIIGPWLPVLENASHIYERLDEPSQDVRGFDLLLITVDNELSPAWAGTASRALLHGTPVRHAVEYFEDVDGHVSLDHFHIDDIPADQPLGYRWGKRLVDICLVILVLPIALPLLLVAMAVIAINMGRPVFFVQDRVGQGGKPFRMFKLRTMTTSLMDAPKIATSKSDARVTPLGQVLRRFRIDELPQLWNVVAGQMSIVGPRPEQPSLAEQYVLAIPAFAYRCVVKPGITGWAQVRAGYAADLEETRVKLSYDLFYVKNISLALDVQILLRTIWTVIGGAGVR